MKAIILASGTGSRLLPVTQDTPKSLLDINGRTILDIEMESLIKCGIEDIVLHISELNLSPVKTSYPS